LQAGGHRFDPDRLHQIDRLAIIASAARTYSSDGNQFRKADIISAYGLAGFARFFDIVNGFLIDAVAHGFVCLRTAELCGTQM